MIYHSELIFFRGQLAIRFGLFERKQLFERKELRENIKIRPLYKNYRLTTVVVKIVSNIARDIKVILLFFMSAPLKQTKSF